MSTPEEIVWPPNDPMPREIEAMFQEAIAKGLWFFCHYQQLWWSPSELQNEQRRGNFRWGAKNFKLRDPAEREAQLVKELRQKEEELRQFRQRLWKRERNQ